MKTKEQIQLKINTMKPKFNLSAFIYIFFGSQIIVYLCWSFVTLSFLIPLIETFKTNESRGFYLMFLFCILFVGVPHYMPFKRDSDE
jgi:hypothetical protein